MSKQTNGTPAVMFQPTHRTRVWYIQAKKSLIRQVVRTPDGDVTAEVGDVIVVYGNGATTVMKPDFFDANFEQLKTEKEKTNE